MEMAATIVIHDTLSQEKVREEREGGGENGGSKGGQGENGGTRMGETGIGAAASHLRSHLGTAQG